MALLFRLSSGDISGFKLLFYLAIMYGFMSTLVFFVIHMKFIEPLGVDAPLDRFSEARAIDHVRVLSKEIDGRQGRHRHRAIAMKQARWPLCRSSVETPPNTGTVRAKATITPKLALFSKLGGATTGEFGRGATIGGTQRSPDTTEESVGAYEHALSHSPSSDKTAVLMASQSSNHSGSRETCRDASHALKTHGDRGTKLLDDDQRTTKVTSRLMKPIQVMEAKSSGEMTKDSNPPPRASRNRRQHGPRVSLGSQSDSRFVVPSKQRILPSQTPSSTDLRQILNAKRSRGGDLHNKLNNRTTAALGKDIILAESAARMIRPMPREPVLRYQTPFSQVIEEMDLSEKFTPSSLGDVGLKWFNRLPAGSIGNFHQLAKSFVARFVTNTKAPKGVGSLLSLGKSRTKSLRNYNKRYWKTFNEIEKCLEELAVEMFARIEDDIWQANQNTGPAPRDEGQLKGLSTVDHERRERREINVVFKESTYKLLV
ncbi:Zn-dependent exopeptidases superfamily protein [Actinidia rufa]|uniref:Zn-dependent exopeptidases superfamily protein n=1 Tax=Actinidia rufa TaxID=165716 RepID=A0A7J0DF00_9ERIC|nr:Zn-dependent exopeptidases superfamily protein [Actinidia rufa]